MPFQFTDRLPPDDKAIVSFSLPLTAEERTRSRHYFKAEEGQGVYLRLPRGTVLRNGDLLRSEDQNCLVRVVAKPEPVLVVTAETPLALLRAAYHLGNRHVPLEVKADFLRLSPDPVLQSMLEQMGLCVTQTILPFEPEAGAYSPREAHTHIHADPHNHSHLHPHVHAHPHADAATEQELTNS